jgi:hypothetical protein
VPRNGTDDQHLRITVVRHYAGLQSEQPDALVDHLQHYGGRAQVSIHGLSPQRRLESVETVQLHLSKAIDSVDLTFTEVPVHVVANRLGHADASVTLRVYAPCCARTPQTSATCSQVPFRSAVQNLAVSKPLAETKGRRYEPRRSDALTWAFREPPVGIEPTTFSLRVRSRSLSFGRRTVEQYVPTGDETDTDGRSRALGGQHGGTRGCGRDTERDRFSSASTASASTGLARTDRVQQACADGPVGVVDSERRTGRANRRVGRQRRWRSGNR